MSKIAKFDKPTLRALLMSKHWSGKPRWVYHLYHTVAVLALIWAVLGIFGVWH